MNGLRTFVVVVALLALASCGGGDVSAPAVAPAAVAPTPTAIAAARPSTLLYGTVVDGQVASIVVCLDRDGDFACGAAEPQAVTTSSGAFEFDVGADVASLNGLHLVAVQGNGVLLAPARPGTVISVFTTLVSTRMLDKPALGADDAETELKALWQLGTTRQLTLDYASPVNDGLQRLAATALPALRAAVTAYADGAQAGVAQSTRAGARALRNLLSESLSSGSSSELANLDAKAVTAQAVARVAAAPCAAGGVTAMTIETKNRNPILTKTDYVAATLHLDAFGTAPAVDLATRIRGRGNSTWGMPKKPYRLKLDEAASLLGLDKEKDWVLLANYADKTLMRNALAFCMGRLLGMAYSPPTRYVELTLNGDYVGLYQLTDQIETGKERVDIGDAARSDTDADAGFLLEIDERLDENLWFYSSVYKVPYTVKSDATSAQRDLIADFIARFEQSLQGESFTDPATGYRAFMETGSLIDVFLVNELMRNNDAFWSSTFVYRQRNGRLAFGPLWDFDVAAGNIDYNGKDQPEGWWALGRSPYLVRLWADDPAFSGQVKGRWQLLHSRMPALLQFLDDTAVALDAAQQRNFQRWDILNTLVWPNPVALGSYEAEVNHLKDWLRHRGDWLESQLATSQ